MMLTEGKNSLGEKERKKGRKEGREGGRKEGREKKDNDHWTVPNGLTYIIAVLE